MFSSTRKVSSAVSPSLKHVFPSASLAGAVQASASPVETAPGAPRIPQRPALVRRPGNFILGQRGLNAHDMATYRNSQLHDLTSATSGVGLGLNFISGGHDVGFTSLAMDLPPTPRLQCIPTLPDILRTPMEREASVGTSNLNFFADASSVEARVLQAVPTSRLYQRRRMYRSRVGSMPSAMLPLSRSSNSTRSPILGAIASASPASPTLTALNAFAISVSTINGDVALVNCCVGGTEITS